MKYFFLIIIVVAIGFFLVERKNSADKISTSTIPASSSQSAEITGFDWGYPVTSGRDADIPTVAVTLVIHHSNTADEKKFITNVDGSCNPEDTEVSLAFNSKQLFCYAAGFGDRFRVIAENNKYLVQRQEFQEAEPENNLPVQDFKTIFTL